MFAAAGALPLPASALGHNLEVDAIFVVPSAALAAAAGAAAPARFGLQVALAKRDDHPQAGAHLVNVQWLLDDVAPGRLQRPQQRARLVAGGLVILLEDCRAATASRCTTIISISLYISCSRCSAYCHVQ